MLTAIRHLAGDVFVFQQDSAPAHRARATVEYLRQATPEFISPDLRLPHSPDFNPVDYKIWGCVQECVYQEPIRDLDQLKQRLVEVWSDVQQTVGSKVVLLRPTRYVNRSFWRFTGSATVNTFSLVKKMKSMALLEIYSAASSCDSNG